MGLVVFLAATLTNSCVIVGYHYPEGHLPATQVEQALHYRVFAMGPSIGGGHDTLRSLMANNRVFPRTRLTLDPPKHGWFVDVRSVFVEPSVGALVWGYLALSTFFLLPAYTGTSGHNVTFAVSIDGQPVRTYQYMIRHRAFAWLPMIPLVWINLLTSSESQAFRAVTEKFFEEVVRDGIFDDTATKPFAEASRPGTSAGEVAQTTL